MKSILGDIEGPPLTRPDHTKRAEVTDNSPVKVTKKKKLFMNSVAIISTIFTKTD